MQLYVRLIVIFFYNGGCFYILAANVEGAARSRLKNLIAEAYQEVHLIEVDRKILKGLLSLFLNKIKSVVF